MAAETDGASGLPATRAVVNTSDSGGLDAAEVEDLLRRLSRIEGQIRGIKKMVMEGRDCRELVTQFSAVSKALEQAALNYVTAQLVYCIEDPDAASANGYTLDDVKRLLARLR